MHPINQAGGPIIKASCSVHKQSLCFAAKSNVGKLIKNFPTVGNAHNWAVVNAVILKCFQYLFRRGFRGQCNGSDTQNDLVTVFFRRASFCHSSAGSSTYPRMALIIAGTSRSFLQQLRSSNVIPRAYVASTMRFRQGTSISLQVDREKNGAR